jgi:hypothetical protein
MSEYKRILELDNEVKARLLESILNEKEIPHLIKSYHDSAYDGLFQMQLGWGHLEAPRRYESIIKAIYEDLG